MNGNGFLWRWRPARLVALAVIIALVPLPALAGEASQSAKTPGLLASVAKLGVTERLTAPRPPTARRQQAGEGDLRSASFFKRPIGIVLLVTMAVGTGYALYSTQHDRVSSPGKK